MLETIKEVLISGKKQELRKKEEIKKRIEEIKLEEKQENFDLIDKKIIELENKLESLTSNLFKRMIHGQDIKDIYQEYINLSHRKTNKINKFNKEMELLLKELHDLSYNEASIEMEIEKIRKASSLADLSLTEKEAQQILKNYSHQDEKNIIKMVFLDIKNNQEIKTREDIYKNMQVLYQTNVSPFVLAMRKILPSDLIKELIDVGIVIDEDKVEFLEELASYTLSPHHDLSKVVRKLERTDRLDSYYYNEIEKALANMERYSNYPNVALSHIMTLSVLVSMAKTNKQKKLPQK